MEKAHKAKEKLWFTGGLTAMSSGHQSTAVLQMIMNFY